MLLLASVIFGGWLLVATIGTWAYFAGDPSTDISQP